MAAGPPAGSSDELASFLRTGVYHLLNDDLEVVFLDPVRLLNDSYTRYRVSASSYYSRSFHSQPSDNEPGKQLSASSSSSNPKKRKRSSSRSGGVGGARELNEREIAAEQRHQEVRPLLLKAHEALLRATDLLSVLPDVILDESLPHFGGRDRECNFVELGSLWQAPLYEISLCCGAEGRFPGRQGACLAENGKRISVQIFNNSVTNDLDDDLEAEFLNNHFILPRKSHFYMSDLKQIRNLIRVHSDHGFNLIVVDPPWENASANQKSMYPTLPNRYFLYLPITQLVHTEGALVALWVTNREKLRMFVENELFPAWGITKFSSFYWLKMKTDGSLIGKMDLFHHRPYECLLVGYISGKHVDRGSTTFRCQQNGQVLISIPGVYSRKPPVGKLLSDYVPGPKPPNCIELFARELQAGWTSWGNESLHFQDSRYFVEKESTRDVA